jgi:hypothetical protein
MNTRAIHLLKKAQEALAMADALQQEAWDMVPDSDAINPNVARLIHNDIESCLDSIAEWIDALQE